MDNKYFKFLYDCGFSDDDHMKLARYLHSIPFNWTNDFDGNRAYDGLAMRREYDKPITDVNKACSMLEFFVGFAWRLNRDMVGEISCTEWVGIMFDNLDILRFTDKQFGSSAKEDLNEILDDWVSCRYGSDGLGGLFPLEYPPMGEDLRDVDMWVQASWWYNENYGEY